MKVKIKDYKFTIKEINDKTNNDFWDKEQNTLKLYGQVVYEIQTIYIWKDLTPTRKRQTVIHELTHAFHDVYFSSYHVKDKFDEENICCFMATYSKDILDIVKKYFKESTK